MIPKKSARARKPADATLDLSRMFEKLTTTDEDPGSKTQSARLKLKGSAATGRDSSVDELELGFSTLALGIVGNNGAPAEQGRQKVNLQEGELQNEPRFGPPPLRAYQKKLCDDAEARLSNLSSGGHDPDSTNVRASDRALLVYLPTGGGKTRVALELMLRELESSGAADDCKVWPGC